jgi:hypothetical protein
VAQRARPAHRRLTTPGSLRLASVALALGLVALGVVATRAATERRHAASAVGADATPLLVRAEELYVALADADAAASTAFLDVGPDKASLRSRYVDDIERAADRLASIAGQRVLSDEGRRSVAEITKGLPVYTERVEAARINTRLGHPVGAAYLRRASDSMRNTMLPAATQVYKEAARQLYTAYERGTSRTGTSAVLIVGGMVVALLLLAQVLVSVRTRRLLNPGLLGATALVVALGVWAGLTLHSQQASLLRSQREGSDQLIVLSTTRILALQSLSAENLGLIEQTTEPHLEHFKESIKSIGAPDGSTGLLGTAADLAARTGSTDGVDEIAQRYADYLAVHDAVPELDDAASYNRAVELVVTDEADAADRLDEALRTEIAAARERLDGNAADAHRRFRGLAAVVAAAAVLAAVLAVVGLQRRIREYR